MKKLSQLHPFVLFFIILFVARIFFLLLVAVAFSIESGSVAELGFSIVLGIASARYINTHREKKESTKKLTLWYFAAYILSNPLFLIAAIASLFGDTDITQRSEVLLFAGMMAVILGILAGLSTVVFSVALRRYRK